MHGEVVEVQVFSFFKGRCPLEAPREESSWQTTPRRWRRGVA